MSAAVTIRPARAEEGELLGELGFAAWAEGVISTAGGPEVDRHHVRDHFIAFCTTGYETILVAEMAGRSVGWGAREDRDNYISDLWVLPDSQGQGVGRILLEALEDQIVQAGYRRAELETAAVNAGGIRFYERAGYALQSRKLKFSRGLGREVEKVRLVKQLPAPAEQTLRGGS
jgi:ribosomal-protein-alanine N-acetyltransferase